MYVRVHVVPGAKKERVVCTSKTEFQISVKEPAERNMANTRVLLLLAQELGVSTKQLRILTGHHSSSKIVSVEDV